VEAKVTTFDVKVTHEFTSEAGSVRRLVRVHPYLRLRGPAESPPVFLQDGKVYDEGGGLVEPPPKWVREQVKALTPAARQAVGWGADVPPA